MSVRLGASLAISLAVSLSAPSAAQEQKGTLIFAVESLAAQTLDPILEAGQATRPTRPPCTTASSASILRRADWDRAWLSAGFSPRTARLDLSPAAGQKFHNGDPLTAHDVKFSLERQMAPHSLAAAAASMRRSFKSIEVVDDLTVRVNSHSPQIGLPAALSRAVATEGAIMPKKYIETVERRSSARNRSAVVRGSSYGA